MQGRGTRFPFPSTIPLDLASRHFATSTLILGASATLRLCEFLPAHSLHCGQSSRACMRRRRKRILSQNVKRKPASDLDRHNTGRLSVNSKRRRSFRRYEPCPRVTEGRPPSGSFRCNVPRKCLGCTPLGACTRLRQNATPPSCPFSSLLRLFDGSIAKTRYFCHHQDCR